MKTCYRSPCRLLGAVEVAEIAEKIRTRALTARGVCDKSVLCVCFIGHRLRIDVEPCEVLGLRRAGLCLEGGGFEV